jgi:hypothetical protein
MANNTLLIAGGIAILAYFLLFRKKKGGSGGNVIALSSRQESTSFTTPNISDGHAPSIWETEVGSRASMPVQDAPGPGDLGSVFSNQSKMIRNPLSPIGFERVSTCKN